jgi:hypothetical protein
VDGSSSSLAGRACVSRCSSSIDEKRLNHVASVAIAAQPKVSGEKISHAFRALEIALLAAPSIGGPVRGPFVGGARLQRFTLLGFILPGHAYHGSNVLVAESKGFVGGLPQALIERPKAFVMQSLLCLGSEVAIANNADYALDAFIIHFK